MDTRLSDVVVIGPNHAYTDRVLEELNRSGLQTRHILPAHLPTLAVLEPAETIVFVQTEAQTDWQGFRPYLPERRWIAVVSGYAAGLAALEAGAQLYLLRRDSKSIAGLVRKLDTPQSSPSSLTLAQLEPADKQVQGDSFKALYELTMTINAVSNDYEKTLETICHAAIDLFHIDHTGLVIFNEEQDRGYVVAEYPPSGTLHQDIPLADIPLEKLLIQEKIPIPIMDTSQADEVQLGILKQILQGYNIQSILLVPIIVLGKVIGSFSLDWIGRTYHFGQELIHLSMIFSSHIALALNRAQLAEQTRAYIKLLEYVQTSSLRIMTKDKREEVIQTFLDEMKELLQAQNVSFYHFDAEEQHFVLQARSGPAQLHQAPVISLAQQPSKLESAQQANLIEEYHQSAEQILIYDPDHPFPKLIEAPLRDQERLLGVVQISGNRPFLQEQRQMVSFLCEQVAILWQKLEQLEAHQQDKQALSHMVTMNQTLRQISEKIQSAPAIETMEEMLLKTVTATYGFGFKRAAFLRYNRFSRMLQVDMAIGASQPQALVYQSMPQEMLAGGHESRPENIHSNVHDFHQRVNKFSIVLEEAELFADILESGQIRQLERDQFKELPTRFRDSFQPQGPLVIAPLIARKWVIGLLIGDGAELPLDQAEQNALVSLCHTTALAIDNAQLLKRSDRAHEQLRNLFEASNTLLSSNNPRQVLKAIVHRVQEFMDALWVSMLQIQTIHDEPLVEVLETTRVVPAPHQGQRVRPNGYSVQAMRENRILSFENTALYQDSLQPDMFLEGVKSAFCVPLQLNGENIGVMWIHCRQERRLSSSEKTALQLYVNQAMAAYSKTLQMEHLQLMRDANEQITRATSWGQITKTICQQARMVLQAPLAMLWPYDSSNEQFLPLRGAADGLNSQTWKTLQGDPARVQHAFQLAFVQGGQACDDLQEIDELLDPAFREFVELTGAHSFLSVPLQRGNERLAVLWVGYHESRCLHTGLLERAKDFAASAAQELQKIDLIEQLGNANRTTNLIAQVRLIDNLDQTLRTAGERIMQHFKADVVSIHCYDPHQARFSFAPIYIGNKIERPRVWSHSMQPQPILRYAFQLDQALFIADTHNDPDFRNSRFVQEEGIRSCLVLPLREGKQTIGALFVNYRQPTRLRQNERQALEQLAKQLAVAVHNEQLKQASNRRIRMLEAIHETVQALRFSVHSYSEILQVIVEQSFKLFDNNDDEDKYSLLMLYNAPEKLSFQAVYPTEISQRLAQLVGEIDLQHNLHGIVGRAFKTRQTQHITNVNKDPDYIRILDSIRSQLAVPIEIDNQVIGVLSLEHARVNAFSQEDVNALETFAQFAAIAISSWQRRNEQAGHFPDYSDRERERSSLRSISHLEQGRSPEEVLCNISARIESQMKDVIASIRLYDEQRGCLSFSPSWSPRFQELSGESDRPDKVEQPLGAGICGWVAQHKRYLLMDDVEQQSAEGPHYIELYSKPFKTQSELALPIMYGSEGKLIGVLDLQSSEKQRFTIHDLRFLEAVADQVAITLQMAKQYTNLSNSMRSIFTWKQDLTRSSAWWHKVNAFAGRIRKEIQFFHMQAPSLRTKKGQEQLAHMLDTIEQFAEHITQQRIPASLGSAEDLELVDIAQFISERIETIKQYNQYDNVELSASPSVESSLYTVRISREWLQHALDLLISNAVKASEGRPDRRVWVSSEYENNRIRILVHDNGCGIPAELRPRLFNEMIDGNGQGLGLVIVGVIARTYEGEASIHQTGSDGTTMQLCFPARS